MTAIFTGQAMLDNRYNLPSLLPEIFDLIDPDGVNVIVEDTLQNNDHLVLCLMKFKREEMPYEIYAVISDTLYNDIVLEVDSSILTNSMRMN